MGSLAARLSLYVLRLMNPSRHVQATLRPGTQDIVVYGLNKEMDTNSVRVGGGRGKATILEVR